MGPKLRRRGPKARQSTVLILYSRYLVLSDYPSCRPLRSPNHDRSLNTAQVFPYHSVLLWDLLISIIDRDMRPPAKLSYRSAIHKKVVFGAGDAWTLPQIQGEVGGDQEPPGNTWRYPMGSKFFLLILNHI